MFPVFMVPITSTDSIDSLDDIPVELVEVDGPDTFPDEDVEINMMFFTETISSEDGLYYVCRRGMDSIAYFGASAVKYITGGAVFTLEFPGSRLVIPFGESPTSSVTNYILGNNPSKWKTGIEDCAVLRYSEIYPGIDLIYKTLDGNLKYEFVVAPHADPGLIQMRYPDAGMLDVYDDRITVSKSGSSFSDIGLWAFQGEEATVDIVCAFQTQDMNTISFHVGPYEESKVLVIDPVLSLVYSTYLGGSDDGDYGMSIAIDDGYIYVAGYTYSTNFPTYNAMNSTNNGASDCFVTKLTADGQSLVYSTYLGGNTFELIYDISVESGYAYISGHTESGNYPTTPDAYNESSNGGMYDIFITKLAADGQSLNYSTYLGGSSDDYGYGIAVENGFAYISGHTGSANFPTTLNAYDTSYNANSDSYVTKLAVDGQSLIYSTYLGGSASECANGIAVESGYAYVTGYTYSTDFPTVNAYNSTHSGQQDCFVTKLSADGQSLVYSTFLGGASNDRGNDIAVEVGRVYITGYTQSSTFPTFNAYDYTYHGATDVFVTKLATDGQSLVYSTFLGGYSSDIGEGIAVESGSVYITGSTSSGDFPTANAIDPTYNGGATDVFVTKLATDGQSLVYSTFLGGSNGDFGKSIAVGNDSAYITGSTTSYGFPTFNAFDSTYNGGSDCFISIVSEDSDSDGLTDWHESLYGTDRFCIDTDNDNFLDAYEVGFGSDPLDPMSYPDIPQAWYDAIYEDLDGNSTLIQNLITWSADNASLLEIVMQQLDDNSTLLTQVISWLDGNHSAIESLFTQLDGNATLLLQTVNSLNENSTLIQNLITWSNGNSTLLVSVIQQMESNATLLQQVIGWLDGNYTVIEDLFTQLEGNATLLLATVNALNSNAILIQNLLTWADGNTTLLQTIMQQLDDNSTLLTQVISWLDGNHTSIETLFTYMDGNATLLLSIMETVNANSAELDLLAALIAQDVDALSSFNGSYIEDMDAIRNILDQLGFTVGDLDYDGLDDLEELFYGTDLDCIDTDIDNLNDAFEIKLGTDPLDDDSDDDLYFDGYEVMYGTDPMDPNDYPGMETPTPTTTGTTTSTTSPAPGDDSPLVLIVIVGTGAGGVVIVVILVMMKKRRAGS